MAKQPLPKPQTARDITLSNQQLKSAGPSQDAGKSPPRIALNATIFPNEITLSTETPGRAKTLRFFQFLIAIYIPKNEANVLVVARQRSEEVSQAVSKWWTKWVHRTAAALLWVIFSSYLFGEQSGFIGWLFEHYWAPGKSSWEGATLATLIALLLLALPRWGPKTAGIAALYIVFFPAVAIFVLIAKLFSALGILAFAVRSVGSISASGANWILILVACVVVDRTSAPWLIVLSTIYLVVSAIYIVLSNFYWVTTPFQSIVHLSEWAQRGLSASIEKTQGELVNLVTQYTSCKPNQKPKLHGEIIKKAETIYSHAKYSLRVAQKVNTLAGGKIVLFYVFALRFLVALLAVIFIFAGIYRGIYRVLPEAFSGGGIKSLWFSFYYSVVTFFTVGDGSVSPQHVLSQAAVVAQVLLAVVTLTVLALSFSTLSVDLAHENGMHVERLARRHFDYCMALMKKRLGTNKDLPSDAYEDLKTSFDKHMRRAKKNKDAEDRQVKPPIEDVDEDADLADSKESPPKNDSTEQS